MGCATRTDPQLERVEPSVVTNLVATSARVMGRDLFGAARANLDRDEATVDRRWRLAVGDRSLDVEWVDPQSLRFEIPAGFAPGTYDLRAESPRGEQLVVSAGLVVTAEPIGLALAVEDAPGGTGQPIARTLAAGDSLTAFAVVRDAAGTFVTDIAATWSVSAPIGTVDGSTLHAAALGTGKLVATRAAAQLTAASGDVTVVPGPAATLAIENAPGGLGQPIGVLALTTDDAITAHAIARDAFGNFVADEVAAWSLTGVTGSHAAEASTVIIDLTTPGTGVLHATSFTTAQTGALAIAPGRAAALVIDPANATISADAAPVTYTATATDADGNPTPNLGSLAWTVDAGPLTALAATGVLDPITSGTGTIRVTSSHGATATTNLQITAGMPTALAIAPPALAVDADAPPTTFTASAIDADGNTTDPGALTWTIGSGPITALSTTGVLDPRAAGTGTIAVTSSLGPTATAPVTITPGRAATLAITPATLDVVRGTAGVPFGVTATDADGNPTPNLGTITWAIASGGIATLAADGTFVPTQAGIGTVRATSSYGATTVSGAVRVRTPAALAASLALQANLLVGETVDARLSVTNLGETAASDVTPCAIVVTGTGAVTVGTAPAATIGAGATQTFEVPVTATGAGTVQLATCATGADAATGTVVTSAQTTASATITPPVILASSLAVPALLGFGKTFAVTMQVTNTGTATATVSPSPLALAGTGGAALVTAPAGGASIAAGGSASFAWTYTTTALGTLSVSGNATGSDAITMAPASSPMTSASADIVEAALVAGDPFGDGTPFTHVVGHRDRILLGPSKTGNGALRLADDGVTFQPLTFRFTHDTNNNQTTNSTAIYSSIGATGCTPNTASCGPDNEDGRGLFTSLTIDGTEWLLIGGARSGGGLDFLYMTADTDSQLDFRYLDLSTFLGGATRGFSAAHVLNDRLYVGFPDNGGARPYLLSILVTPPWPGLDLTTSHAINLDAGNYAPWQTTSVAIVDAIWSHTNRLYVANHAGILGSTSGTPRSTESHPFDWDVVTPTAAAYTAKSSRTTVKMADIEPRDRAFPQFASFGGRIWVGRNTTAGPQLWSCDPTGGFFSSRCEASEWRLVAPNSTGDAQLTQFDNPALTSITMVVATASALYIGFDSAAGVQVFRTSTATASTRADFVGQLGCSAALHPATCAGIGGAGFGSTTDQRIFDAKAITVAATTSIWITVGDASSALGLVVLP